MSVDPEPRQRTVAELLAENGGAQSGRRRRRRASEDDDAPLEAGPPQDEGGPAPQAAAPPPGGPAAPPNGRFAGGYAPEPPAPARNGYEQNGNGQGPNGQGPNGQGPNGQGPNGHAPNGYAPAPAFGDPGRPAPNGGPPPSPPRGRPVVPPPPPPPPQAPGRRGPEPSPPGGMPATPGPYGPGPGDRAPDAESPTGAFGARPPAAYGGPPPDTEGGPPTQLGAPPLDDDALDDLDERAWTGEAAEEQYPIDATAPRRPAPPSDGGPPTQAGYAPPLDDDYEDHGEFAAGAEDDPDEYRRSTRRRTAVAGLEDGDLDEDLGDGKAAGTGQAWAMVIAQWVGGAVVGAGVWVGFRYLWYSLPVVALALAVVLTVGLVLGVRALLRNDDLRTTMFAVLVGLLLTVSPALLVLLDR